MRNPVTVPTFQSTNDPGQSPAERTKSKRPKLMKQTTVQVASMNRIFAAARLEKKRRSWDFVE